MSAPVRWFLIIFGILNVVLGIIGAFLPVLPTVPFLILAAFCFSKSSPRMQAWVHSLPHAGPLVKQWEQDRCIPRRAKFLSSAMIIVGYSTLWIFWQASLVAKCGISSVGFLCLGFIWTRPSVPVKTSEQQQS